MHRHLWGGLTVGLPFPLPELAPQRDPEVPVDVTVSVAPIPAPPAELLPIDDRQLAGGGAYLFNRGGIARYWVQDGTRVLIEPEAGVSTATVAAYLLGRPFAALAYQRGWLSIHGGAAVTAKGAFVFTAPARTGKSTLLSALDRLGMPLLSDDAALVRPGGGAPLVWPSSQRFRLNPDSAEHVPLDGRAASPVRENFAKVAIPFQRPAGAPVPLAGIFLLRRGGDAVDIGEPLRLVEAIDGVTQNLNRPRLAEILRGRGDLLAQVAEVARQVPVRRLTVPDALGRIGEAAERLAAM